MTMFSLADWEKTTIEEVKRRWGNRRRELEEIERKKKEKEERIEIWKKKKEKKRKRVIRERRCFVCRIFGHMAHNCRNRKKKKGLTQMPLNRFEVLRDKVMQKEEGSGKEIGKDRREILREERKKKEKMMKLKVQKKDLEKKKEEKKEEKVKKEEKKTEEKIEVEREVEM